MLKASAQVGLSGWVLDPETCGSRTRVTGIAVPDQTVLTSVPRFGRQPPDRPFSVQGSRSGCLQVAHRTEAIVKARDAGLGRDVRDDD